MFSPAFQFPITPTGFNPGASFTVVVNYNTVALVKCFLIAWAE